jgi:O-antigen/teichoic acid export membrane protein
MSVARQSSWGLLPVAAGAIVGVVSAPLFLRFLGAEMFALWSYVTAVVGMFGFADLGLGITIAYHMGTAIGRRDAAGAREYWATGHAMAIPLLLAMGGLFMGAGLWLGARWFSVAPLNIPLLQQCFVLGGLGLFLNYYAGIWRLLLQAHLDFKYLALMQVVFQLTQIPPALWIAYHTRNPFHVLIWMTVISAAQLIAFMHRARTRYGVVTEWRNARVQRIREMAGYTAKTFLNLVAGAATAGIDKLLLGRLIPVSAACDYANYEMAGRIGNRFLSVGTAVMGPIFHNTSRATGGANGGASRAIYAEGFHLIYGWAVLAGVWCTVWHAVLMRVWLGPLLGNAVGPLFVPVTLAFCVAAVVSLSSPQLGASNRMGVALGFTIVTGLLTVLGVGVGWRVAGVVGAGYGFLFSRVGLLLQDLYVQRLMGGPLLYLDRWGLKMLMGQACLGGLFALCLFFHRADSLWMMVPAGLHACAGVLWLLCHYPAWSMPAGVAKWIRR